MAPTRRIALGNLVLPVDPAPGFGGLLLGAVVTAHIADVSAELVPDVHRLIDQIDRDERVVQPRLRHRFQVDRHGLALSTHRLLGTRNEISFDLHTTGTGAAQVLGAIYAVERLDPASRRLVTPVLHRAMRWRGPVGPKLIAHLAGANTDALSTLVDPRAWALDVLGFAQGTATPTRKEVTAQFRAKMRTVHPDHGGDHNVASTAVFELAEARRILIDAVDQRMTSRRSGSAGTLLLFPGASSGRDHPSLVAVEKAVAPAWATVRADFVYRREGRRAPDRPPKLLATVREELAAIASHRVVVGGRSMGGRMCSMVAAGADGEPVPDSLAGVVLMSYPLHPPGKPANLRVDHLSSIRVPCLFVHGTRDPFGSPAELEEWTGTIPGAVTHHWIDGGHDLKGADDEIASTVAGWLESLR